VGAYFFMGRGAYVDAERYYRLGLETAERLLAGTDPRIGQLANGLGFALKALERLFEAETKTRATPGTPSRPIRAQSIDQRWA
jgi:hypothetical protein